MRTQRREGRVRDVGAAVQRVLRRGRRRQRARLVDALHNARDAWVRGHQACDHEDHLLLIRARAAVRCQEVHEERRLPDRRLRGAVCCSSITDTSRALFDTSCCGLARCCREAALCCLLLCR